MFAYKENNWVMWMVLGAAPDDGSHVFCDTLACLLPTSVEPFLPASNIC